MRSIGIGSKTARQQLAGVGFTSKMPSGGFRPAGRPTPPRSTCIGDERSYNEFSASNCCRVDRGRFDLCQCSCADAAAVSASGSTTAAETDAACAVNATAGNPAANSDHSATSDATASNAAVTRGESAFHNRGVLSDLPGGSVPGVVRRRARSAVLHLRSRGAVCRRGDVLPHAT